MLDLLLRMSGATLFYVLVTVTAWRFTSRRKLRLGGKILLGLLFGGCSVLSTHFGVNYDNMVLNVRDLGPLAAALFFDPLSHFKKKIFLKKTQNYNFKKCLRIF